MLSFLCLLVPSSNLIHRTARRPFLRLWFVDRAPAMEAEGEDTPMHKANHTYKSRFSTLRFNKAVKKFCDKQRGYVIKYKFGALLTMPKHLMIPLHMLEWINRHMFCNDSSFRHNEKVFKVTKDMVDKIFDFPGGTVPFIDDSDDPTVKAVVAVLRSKYVDSRGKIPLSKLEAVMLSEKTEEGFIRSFVFFFIATILCPATYNFANPCYLYSLRDVTQIPLLDFGSLCLDFMFQESLNHGVTVFNRLSLEEINKPSYIAGCLPIWAIIYMDFVDFNHVPNNESTTDYSLPRITHIKNEDFEYLAQVDRNYKSRKSYGVLPIRHISQTPYAGNVANDLNNNHAPPIPTPLAEPALNNVNNGSAPQNPNGPINLSNLYNNLPPQTPYPEPQVSAASNSLNEPVHIDLESNVKSTNQAVHGQGSVILISPGTSVGTAISVREATIQIDNDSPSTPGPLGSMHELHATLNEADTGVQIAMSYAEEAGAPSTLSEPATGPSTAEKRNRKRAAKVISPDQATKKLKVSVEVDKFYTKYLRKPYFQEQTLFVDIEGFPVFYEKFFASFKSRGEIADEVMNSLVQVLNADAKLSSLTKPFIKKYTFTSYFTDDLQALREKFLFQIATYSNNQIQHPFVKSFLQKHAVHLIHSEPETFCH